MININLIAERRSRKIREMTILRVSTLSLVLLTACLMLLNALAFFNNQTAKNTLKDRQQQLKKQEPEYSALQATQQEINVMTPVVGLLNNVKKSEAAWMTVMGDISQLTAQNVVIDSINSTATDKTIGITIAGKASDEKAVSEFMLALYQETGWADTPVLQSVNADVISGSSAGVRFNVVVPVRGLVGGEL